MDISCFLTTLLLFTLSLWENVGNKFLERRKKKKKRKKEKKKDQGKKRGKGSDEKKGGKRRGENIYITK